MANLFNSPTALPVPDSEGKNQGPYVRLAFSFADLGSGATDTLAFPTLPAGSIPLHAEIEITEGWTAGGGNTTGMTLQIGDAADPDELRTAGNVVGVAAGLVADSVMGRGADHFNGNCEITPYACIITATATGGDTELDHIDAGAAVARLYYKGVPLNL